MKSHIIIVVIMFAVIVLSAAKLLRAQEFSVRTSTASDNADDLAMTIGEQYMFDAESIDSFSESTKGVIEIKVPRDGKKMIITAIRSGTTSLMLFDKQGSRKTVFITVFARMPETVEKELKELFAQDKTLTFKKVGARVFVDGEVRTDSEKKRVEQAVKGYNGQAISLIYIDPDVVQPRTNIRLDLTFVELKKRDNDRFGISWPSSYGGSGVLSGSIDLLTGTLSAAYQLMDQAMPSLEVAAQYGWIKIHKKAALITVNGRKSTYEAGGEVNVAVAGSQAAELRTIPYGARLIVTPRLSDDDKTLDLEVIAEVSDLSETTQNVPGRTMSRVDTLVHLGIGQSIMLSGLNSESKGVTKEGFPYLSKIPILGLLFGTRRHVEEQTESLIVITPTVLDRPDRIGKKLLDEAAVKFQNFEGKFK